MCVVGWMISLISLALMSVSMIASVYGTLYQQSAEPQSGQFLTLPTDYCSDMTLTPIMSNATSKIVLDSPNNNGHLGTGLILLRSKASNCPEKCIFWPNRVGRLSESCEKDETF